MLGILRSEDAFLLQLPLWRLIGSSNNKYVVGLKVDSSRMSYMTLRMGMEAAGQGANSRDFSFITRVVHGFCRGLAHSSNWLEIGT